MPRITIQLWEGKSIEEKRTLVRNVTEAVATSLQLAPELVIIVLQEMQTHNWARGGILRYDEK